MSVKGYTLEVPTLVETSLTGWLATARFERRGQCYAVRFIALRTPECLRNGQPIDYYALPKYARAIAEKAADFLTATHKLRAA